MKTSLLPRGGRPSNAASCDNLSQVSIRALAGEEGDEFQGRYKLYPSGFQFALRTEGDGQHAAEDLSSIKFQSPPRGGRPSVGRFAATLARFNPRPRAGGDRTTRRRIRLDDAVSIHAPARGATDATASIASQQQSVSIHAPARGATRLRPAILAVGVQFQSTPPRGGRHGSHCVPHADLVVFQSTPPRGGRHDDLRIARISRYVFQSTPPRGGRLRRGDCL